jgi:hypothetical protein
MRILRPLLLGLAVAGLGWFQFGQPLTARALVQRAEDSFDRRPARTILILGNSRTYFHDMPDMVRAMADSAHDPRKYEIMLDAPPGASFEILWGDARTQDLLKQRWDDVVLQGESRAQASDELERSFQTYGDRLIRAARLTSGRPRLVVNWVYEERLWDGDDPDGSGRNAYFAAIQSQTAALGERAGASLVNIGRLWGEVASDHPDIVLTEDGNHPTLAGSYLFALLLYGDLSGGDVGAVTFVPAGLDTAAALRLRQAARDYQAMS